ncbi:hypothetical protein C8J57DRAFT_1506044 [Mycena rebaudengoi]|nr:hypothetical protein C8J57DRAFT_1506044 [Mycena rebaudengoi]
MAPKRKATDTDPADGPAPKAWTKKSNLPSIPWKDDDNKLIWALLTEIEKSDNSKSLFGTKAKGENTSGDTKAAVYKHIGEAIVPDMYKLEPSTVGDRSKAMVEKLIKGYKENAACLRQTGGGVGAEEAQEEGSQTVNMAFYIPATGPDCTTVPDTANLWEEIIKCYPFFPRLHVIFATRPNVTPIAISTGLGPSGPSTVYYQPPDEATFAPTPAQIAQFSTLHEVLCAAGAYNKAQGSILPGDDVHSGSENGGDNEDEDTEDHVGEDAHRNGGAPVAPATPSLHTGKPTTKENMLPTTASKSRAPKALQQDASVERARAAIKKIPVKRTPLEMLFSLQETNLNSKNARANAEVKRADGELLLKKRGLLLKELELGVWTPEEYRKKLKKLDKKTSKHKKSVSQRRREERASLPEWPSELPSSDGIPDDDSE